MFLFSTSQENYFVLFGGRIFLRSRREPGGFALGNPFRVPSIHSVFSGRSSTFFIEGKRGPW